MTWIKTRARSLALRSLSKIAARLSHQLIPDDALRGQDQYLDKSEFRYILWLDRIYSKIASVPGHIVELGVARGRNAIIFGNLIRLNGDDAIRSYYGFDTFSGYTESDIESSPHLDCSSWKNNSAQFVKNRLARAGLANLCTLIEGDIKETVPRFLTVGRSAMHNPNHFRAALLYVDCNAYLPSLIGMESFKDYMSPGGIICIDEKLQGGETRALIDFCEKHNLKFQKDSSPFSVPAYTVIERNHQA